MNYCFIVVMFLGLCGAVDVWAADDNRRRADNPLLPDQNAFTRENQELENAEKAWARAVVAHVNRCSRRNVTPLQEQRIIEQSRDGSYAQWFKTIENEMLGKRKVLILEQRACLKICEGRTFGEF
jgi:hypothetical protein